MGKWFQCVQYTFLQWMSDRHENQIRRSKLASPPSQCCSSAARKDIKQEQEHYIFFPEGCWWCWAPVMHAACITASCPGLWPDCVYHYPIILNGVCKLNIYSPSTICHAKVFSKCPPEAGSATTSVRKTQDLEWYLCFFPVHTPCNRLTSAYILTLSNL